MQVGTRLDERYELLSELGAGGMATVWRALDHRLGVERAIKVLGAEFRGSSRLMVRFEREARLMAQLETPHIAPVHDIVVGDEAYIVMSLFTGGSLRDHLASSGALSPRTTVETLLPLLEALQTAHAHGVVHRDVKPHNVLLDSRGRPRLTDFGIASDAADSGLTRTGAVMGTWTYMAPEQRTSAKGIDARADLYALGAMAAEMVVGHPVAELHAVEAHAELEGVPDGLREFVIRCTRFHPDDRFPSASAASAALVALLPSLPWSGDALGSGLPAGEAPASVVRETHDTVLAWMDSQASTEPHTWVETEAPIDDSVGSTAPRQPTTNEVPPPFEPHPLVPVLGAVAVVAAVLGAALVYGLQGEEMAPLSSVSPPVVASPADVVDGVVLPTRPAVQPSPPEVTPAPVEGLRSAQNPPVPVSTPPLQPEPSQPAVAPVPVTAEPVAVEAEPIVAESTGRVRIASRPPDATVRIDDVVVGTSTWSAEAELGEHWVMLEHPDHPPVRRKIVVTEVEVARLCWDFVEDGPCS